MRKRIDWRRRAGELRASADEHIRHAEVLRMLAEDCDAEAREREELLPDSGSRAQPLP